MNQEKIGRFLKQLRLDKALTQAQTAEYFGVSNRTISRWETGVILPDIAVLLEVADFYDIDLRELLNGEREANNMDHNSKVTAKKVEEYTADKYKKILLIAHIIFIIALIGLIVNVVLVENDFFESNQLEFIAGLGNGIASGIILIGVLYTSPWAKNIRKFFE